MMISSTLELSNLPATMRQHLRAVSKGYLLTMTTDSTTKRCIACGLEKPISEFYMEKTSTGNKPYPRCKPCHIIKVNSRPLNRVRTDKPLVASEATAIKFLNRNGIFTASGKLSSYKYLDAVAWGCVRIEIKTSHKREGRFDFRFSYQQKNKRLQADIIILQCFHNIKTTYHIFPANHPAFYENGALKSVSYSLRGQSNDHGLTTEIMNAHENAFHYIEEARQNIIRQLLAR